MAETFPKLETYVQTWEKQFSDWEIKFWKLDTIIKLLESLPNGDHMLTVFNNLPNKGAQSDFARYVIVYVWGGMYADTDMECLRNFSCLLHQPGKKMFVTLNEDYLALEINFGTRSNNHWFYCPEPGFDGLYKLIMDIASTKVSKKDPIKWTIQVTGPGALSKMTASRDDIGYICWHLLEAKSVHVNVQKLKKNSDAFPSAFAIHHAGAAWNSRKSKLRDFTKQAYGFTRQNSLIILIVLSIILIIMSAIILWLTLTRNKR